MEEEKNEQAKAELYHLSLVQRRQKALCILFVLIFIGISVRLFWIQVMMNDTYMKKATNQKLQELQTGVNRGQIFDRNMIPFTDRALKKFVSITPYISDKEATAELVSDATGVGKEEILRLINEREGNFEIKAKEFDNDSLSFIEKGLVKGVSVLEKKIRYTEDSLARHIIGYINSDLNGVTGIEKSMNSLLKQGGSDKIVAIVDSHKSLIPGLGFRKIETTGKGDKFGLKLTLDFHIQKIVEDVLKTNAVIGSAVVMDVKSGEILAMASTPDFDPNNVKNFLSGKNDELVNKAISPHDLGSIFKTVVAAAAIENNAFDPEETFLCEGEIKTENSTIKCSTYSTHENRPITFKEAFALSCNTTLIKVGSRVGADTILDMAKRMGFGEKQCTDLLEEKPGNIPTSQEDGIGNISIGQGKIQVTPLQVTTMMATIANKGIMNYPSILKAVVDNETGAVVQTMTNSQPTMILKSDTIQNLQSLLREVTVSGTGKQANLDEFGGSSGKTGSAETGMQNETNRITHGWFAGYVPADRPQYAITVFVYNGKSGGKAAAPLFREIAYNIFTKYKPIK